MATVEGSLGEISSNSQTENVAIFIADSMRFDALPSAIANRGVSARAIAPSTYTGSSIPSLISGLYPAEHKVWDFNGRLIRKPVLLQSVKNTGFNAETIWTDLDPADKPPLRMVRATPGEPLERLPEPFVYIEHDKGGHTPYGHSFDEYDSQTFYTEQIDDASEIPELYADSIDTACERFERMLDTLEDRNLLENTLVVFTADHGELLGEPDRGGVYGHGRPMVPEVVDVPLVFIGGGLSEGDSYSNVLSGVDIVPTALGAQGRAVPNQFPGRDLWSNPPKARAHRSDVWFQTTLKGHEIGSYKATSLWSDTGGLVRHGDSRGKRLIHSHNFHCRTAPHAEIFWSQWSVRTHTKLLKTYLPSAVRYGTIDSTITDQMETLSTEFDKGTRSTDEEIEDYSKEQLEKLGYV